MNKYGIPPIEEFEYTESYDIIKYWKMVLSLTDYEVIKAMENGTEINEELKAYRQHARDEINKRH